ncbi:hypothetical protein FQN54_007998 [Arachnomyces sp. PD_36]|nr:hypothetical protein FQN54_007998 [Arachnomyces sp. PD_36]
MGGKDGLDPLFDSRLVMPALKVGAISGTSGLIYGGISGVLRSPHPVIHSVSTGIHWFAFGTSFWWLRSNINKFHFNDKPTAQQRVYSSSIASGVSGGGVVWAISRGRIIPGVVVFSILGYLGQSSYNILDEWQLERGQNGPTKPLMQRVAEHPWVPFKVLSDQQYREILDEKLLSVEAEICIVDEQLDELRKSKSSSTDEKAER